MNIDRVWSFQRYRAHTGVASLCRYIELLNGLRVLLISDFSGTEEKADGENDEDNQERGDGEEEEEGEEDGDSGEGSEEDEEEDEEEEQDSDFEELDEENAAKKTRGSSEKQVSESSMETCDVEHLKSVLTSGYDQNWFQPSLC